MTCVLEPFSLGLSSGLLCLTACGPVVLPWLASEGAPLAATLTLLARFLVGRLVGYLGFAFVVWLVGLALPLSTPANAVWFGVVRIALAAALVVFVVKRPRACENAVDCTACRLVTAPSPRRIAPFVLGLTSGLSPCPPFIVAGVRAAERQSLMGSLLFFSLFFVGTSMWFVPIAGVAAGRRFAAVAIVARLTAMVVAGYYGYLGFATLGGILIHG